MDWINDDTQIDRLAYITYNNPTGVQKVLYQYGFPAAESKENLYALAARMLEMYPDSNPKLFSVHPDKEHLLELFGQVKKIGVCNLCKSNFTQTDAEGYKKEWEQKGSDAIKNEYERLREEYNSIRSVNNPDVEEQRGEISAKQGILLELLGQDTLEISGGAAGGGAATTVESSSSSATSASEDTSSIFDSLTKTQKYLGIAAAIVLVAIGAHHVWKNK